MNFYLKVKKILVQEIIQNSNSNVLYNEFGLSTDKYLTHHWPISNGKMEDSIGMAHMTQGSPSVTFSPDRFGTPNSAINLSKKSYTQVPSGIYFDSPTFTISAWIYPLNPSGVWSRVIDFGNGAGSDNILFTIGSSNGDLKPALSIWKGSQLITDTISPKALASSQWQLLTATFDGKQTHIYINGSLMNSASINYSPTSLNRTKTYIGKSNWDCDGFSDSLLDDLRFYNKSLNQTEIIDLMNFYSQNTKYFSLSSSQYNSCMYNFVKFN